MQNNRGGGGARAACVCRGGCQIGRVREVERERGSERRSCVYVYALVCVDVRLCA